MAFPFLGNGAQGLANRRQRRNEARQRRASASLVFEALEPRVLLSADPLSVSLGGDALHPMAHDVIIQQVTQPASGRDRATVQMIQVVDRDQSNAILASAPTASVGKITITSGTGDTSLTVDTISFGGHALPPITFSGGNGNNTLAVSSSNETDWAITGANSGAVSGSAAIAFSGVGNLTGGTNNTDVFTVTPGGALAGTLDGGPGGKDSLVFNKVNATDANFTASGPQSGSVALDGSVFTYAGLEPILFSGNAADITVSGTGQLTLGDTGTPGQIEAASTNNSMESVTFAAPTHALSVDLTSGADSLAIGTLHLPGADLNATGTGADSITVNAGALVSTRAATSDAPNAPSFADSGNLSLTAATVTVDTGASLTAAALDGFTPGAISLDAVATGTSANAAAAVHGATIIGGSVAIDAAASAMSAVSQTTLATLDLDATATAQVDGASTVISTVGAVDIDATDNVNGLVTATAAPLGSLNADAAVALAHVDATATAGVSGNTLLDSASTLSVHSANTTTVTTLADGSAGGATSVGGSVALSYVGTGSTALVGAGVNADAVQMLVGATSTTIVSTHAIATAGGAAVNGTQGQGALAGATTPDGAVTVAAAIAGTDLNDTAAATMSAATVETSQGLDVTVNASREVATLADAGDVSGQTGVGAAVALNAIGVSSNAELAGVGVISGDVSVAVGQARTPDVFGAVALSGAGASDVGVAGALAVNGVSDSAFGGVAAGADIDIRIGGLTVGVTQTGDAVTDALAFLSGTSTGTGIGASVAIAPVHFSAEAGVGAGAQLQVGDATSPTEHDAGFDVVANRSIDTVADGGTSGGTATAAALALTVARDDASSELDAGAVVTVEGNLGLDARQSSLVHTTGQAEALARATVVGFGIALDDTEATVSAVVQARNAVALTAGGTTTSTTLATASPRGVPAGSPSAAAMIASELAFLNNPAGVSLPVPATADGAFGVAAAMALGVAIGRVAATIEPAAGAAETITASRIALNAVGSTNAVTRADASAVAAGRDGGGIGAALALQVGQANILAEDDAPISAPAISLDASGPTGDIPQPAGNYTVQAISGAGAKGVGVAGAMAIGGDGIKVQALLNGAATATGTVFLGASGRSVSDVDATALTFGRAAGVGASFAFDVSDATVTAAIEDGGSVAGLPVLTLEATGGQAATTTAEGGAVGGTATGADFALAVITDEITAGLTAKAVAVASRTLLRATGDSTATTTATGDAGGATTAVGASLALGFLVDDVAARVDGELLAAGGVDMIATGTTTQTTTATSGARGAAAGGLDANSLLGNQIAFLDDPNGVTAPTLATADGALGVAAALSFGVDDATAETVVTGRLGTDADLAMTATGGTDAASNAGAAAVDSGLKGTGIAAAAAVMVATPTIRARIDGAVIAADATLSAGTTTPEGHTVTSHALSGVGGNDTGVAGAFALTVARPVTEAAIGGAGRLDDLGGDAMLAASGASDIAATAAAANLGSGKFGLGASVALDIAADDTHARLEQGARVTDVDDLTLTATGTIGSAAHAAAGSAAGGVAGAVAVNIAPQDTRAEIDGGTALTIAGNLLLEATQSQDSIADAVGGASGRGGGFGAAIAVNAPVAGTGARLDRGVTVAGSIQILSGSTASAEALATAGADGAPSGNSADQDVARWLDAAGTDGSTTPPTVPSIADATTSGAQQLGLSLPNIASAAALAVDAAFGSTDAGLDGSAIITAAGAITVRALGDSAADATADASAIAPLGAAGIGFAVDYDAQGIDASVGATTPVHALSLTVEAMVPRDHAQAASAEAQAGADAAAGVAGAIALNLVDDSTEAQILGAAPILAPDFIVVDAIGDTDASVQAGYLAAGLVAGSGVSLAANLVVDHTEASLAPGARLNSLGIIDVEAEGAQSLSSLSAGIALAGIGAVPASITADVLLATTAALIGKGARIDLATPTATNAQRVLVLASDTTQLDAQAGSLGAGTLVGAGAAAQFSDLVKQTTADIDGTVDSKGDVDVSAKSAETGLTGADAGTLSPTVSVAGGAAVQLGSLLTHAAIDGDAVVHAVGDVVVTALDTTEMDILAGGFDAALVAAAGAGVGAIGLMKTTEALVEANATVDTQGEGAGSQVPIGFSIAFVDDNPAPGEVGKPLLPDTLTDIFSILLNNPVHNLLSPVGSIPDDPFSSMDRVATPESETVHGLAVTALSHDDLAIQTTGLGAAGLAALELSASGIADQSSTQAEIGAAAAINQGGFAGSTAQSVLVAAAGDEQAMAIAGSLPIGGLAAVGPATALIDMHPNTEASVGTGAKITAADGVTVQAVNLTDLLNDATGAVLGGGLATVAGSADAVILGGDTYAWIDAKAVVTAGGSVSVSADEIATTQNVAGGLSTGSGLIFAGGVAALSLVATDVEAWIGADAHVTSLGALGEGVIAVDSNPADPLGTTFISGVSVLASTDELIMDLIGNASGGGSGLAFIGSAAGVVIGNTTAAFVGDGAVVQAGLFDAQGQPVAGGLHKSVAVGALDFTHSFDGVAAVVDGDLAVSGAADAGVVRNQTAASIDPGVVLRATGNIDVAAHSTETVDSFVGGLGLTSNGIELNISASVYSIGAVVPGDLLDPLAVVGGPGDLEGYLDGVLQGAVDKAGNGLVGVLDKYAAAVGGSQAAAAQLAALTPDMPVTTAFTATSAGPAGTTATVNDASLTAFGAVQVTAVDAIIPDLDTSFTFSKSTGGGSQGYNLSLDGGLLAGRANATASIIADSAIQASGDIDVIGDASTTNSVNSTFAFNNSTGNATALVDASRLTAGGAIAVDAEMDGSNKYSGLMPGISGLKIRTSYDSEKNTTLASVTDGATLFAMGAVTVSAISNSSDNIKADGATLFDAGFLDTISLGVALAWNDLADTTSATIEHSAVQADSTTVTSTANTSGFALAMGAADGDNNTVALGGSASRNILDDIVSATIEDSSVIADHGVSVLATDNVTLLAISGSAAARTMFGLGGAASVNTSDDVVTAEIGDSMIDVDAGDIDVLAHGTSTMSALAAGFDQSKTVAIGAGLPVDNLGMTIAARVVGGSEVFASGNVAIHATGDGTIRSLAGGVAVATEQFAFGAALSIDNDTETVSAGVSDSHVAAKGSIDVQALSDPEIDALAIGFAYAPTVAAGGSVSINNITATTSAFVDDQGGTGSVLLAGGAIGVSAIDAPNLEVLTGAAAISKGKASIAGSVSRNNIDDDVETSIGAARLVALAGPIIVQGVADPDILAIAASAAGAQNFAGEGAVAVNTIGTTVDVTVGERTTLLDAPVVSVTGADTSTIEAMAYGASAAQTIALAGSVATNRISGGMTVQLDAAGRIIASTAILGASNTATVEVITAAADGAGTASGGAAVSVNAIADGATAEIVGGEIDAHSVQLSADQSGTIKALAAIGSGAGTFAGVASVTTNNIHDAATTDISAGATINTGSGGALTDMSTNAGEIDSFSGAVAGAGTVGIAAAVANNNISENNGAPSGANATVQNATISGGSAKIASIDGVTIDTIAISGAGASNAAFGGSVAKSNGRARAQTLVSDDTETLTGALAVTATSDGDVESSAANGEGAGTLAGGAAIVVNTLSNNVDATLRGGVAKAGSVFVVASDTATMMAVAAVGTGAGTIAGVFSDTENVVSGNVGAAITGAANVTAAGAVAVNASESGTAKSLSGAASGAGTAAIAGAHAHSRIGDVPPDSEASDPADQTPPPASTTASIDGGSVVGAGSIGVGASFTGDIETLALAGAGAGTVAAAGSVTDNLIGDQVVAAISGAGTSTIASGAVDVIASNDATIKSLAGALAGSGTVAGGAAVAVNKLRNAAYAEIDAATVQSTAKIVLVHATGGGEIDSVGAAGGIAATVAIGAAVSVNDLQNAIFAEAINGAAVTAAQGISLLATDGGTIDTLAASIAGAGVFAGSGAVATNAIANRVTAQAVDATLQATGGSVTIGTTESASIMSGSDAVSGGEVGATASVSVNQIDNVLLATVDASVVRAAINVIVQSADTSSIESESGQIAVGFVGVGGAAAYNEIENTVDATIADGAQVVALGDVLVQTAEDASVETLSAGGNAGAVAVGGSVSVSIIANDVEAAIQSSSVFAAGNVGVIADDQDNMNVWGGQISAGAVGIGASVAVLTLESTVTAAVENATVAAEGHTPALITPDIDTTDGSLTSGSASGVVVVARDQEEADVKALTVAAGAVGVGATVADVHSAAVTDAHIAGSLINSATSPGSGVLVHAAQATDITGYIGNVAAGLVGIGVAVQVSTIENTTRAYMADQVEGREGPKEATAVYANSITVSTATHEEVSANTVGIAAGYVGVGGSVAYSDIESTNDAFVHDALLDAKKGVAGITVAALDNASINTFAGNASAGFVGVGAAVGAATIGNVTLATLIGAQLNANGAITVRADSTEALNEIVVGAAGGFVGVAGSVLVDAIHSDTEATTVPDGAQGTLINQDPTYGGKAGREGGNLQTVDIEASDDASIEAFTGAAAVGAVAVGAAIHVGGITDHVAAEVGSGTQIDAAGDVTVTANTQRDLDDTVFAGAGGAIALSGAFSILSIGGAFDPTATQQVNSGNGGNSQGVAYEANSSLSGKPATSLFNPNDSSVAQDAANKLNAMPAPSVGDPLANPSGSSGTYALVDNPGPDAASMIHAGGDLKVSASNVFSISDTGGAASGGLISLGASIVLISVTDTTHAAISGGPIVSAGRDIDVSASDRMSQPSSVGAYTGTGGVAAIGGAVSALTLTLDVLATIGGNVTVQHAASVAITADQQANLQTDGFDAGGGLIAAGAVVSESTIGGSVSAQVGQSAHLGTTGALGALNIVAQADDIADTNTTAGSGGVVAGEVNVASSHVSPKLTATLANHTITDVAGDVSITTASTGNAAAEATGVDVGALALGLSKADATFKPTGTAGIGQLATLTAGGDVTVEATHLTTDAVEASSASSGGGLISGNGAESTAVDDGSAKATVGDDTVIDAAGTLRIFATSVNYALAEANTLSIGFVAVGGQVATATAAGKTTAELGSGATVDASALQVEAAGQATAETTSDAAAGGLLSGVGAGANSTASPTVTATIGAHADVTVLGNVDVIAVGEGAAHGETSGTDGAALGSVSDSKTTITGVPVVEALVGDFSTIQAGEGVHVLVEAPQDGNISNGTFDAATAVFPGLDAIQIGGPTLLQTGDQVVYRAGNGTPIGGLTDGRSYSVIVLAPGGSSVSLGQQFAAAQVDAATSTIRFARPDGFVTGDKVVYSADGGPAIGGLTDGATYYVRVIDATTIKLATSLGEAIGAGQVFNPALIGAGGLITMAGNGFTNGEAVTYRTTGAAIAGLVDGDTYFVARVNANQFRLTALPGGLALLLGQGAVSGVQTLGSEGVALDGVGITGLQSLAFALSGGGTGTQQLVGAGGAAAALQATSDLGYTGSAAASGGAAFLGATGSKVNITVSATTSATIGDTATVIAGSDVTVNANAERTTDVVADGSASGFIAPGGSYGTTVDVENTTAQVVNGAHVTAGQDVSVTAVGEIIANGEASSSGGGGVKTGQANSTITLEPITSVQVGASARIAAARDVILTAAQLVSGTIMDSATGGGAGDSSHADGIFQVGTSIPATLSVQVGNDATLGAGRDVTASAENVEITPTISNYASSEGIYAHPTTKVTIDVNAPVLVSLGAGDSVTAVRQVNLLASYGTVNLSASADTHKVGIGKQDPEALVIAPLAASVTVAAGVTITTHGLEVDAIGGLPKVEANATESLVPQPGAVTEAVTVARDITFDGNAILLSGPVPYLVVNRFGQVVDDAGVSGAILNGTITVNAIEDTSPGWVHFVTDAGIAYDIPPLVPAYYSVIKGQGSFTFVDSFQTVTLQNWSALNMVVNDIDPVEASPAATIEIAVDNTAQFSFTVANRFDPTTITIGNDAAHAAGNLSVAGEIEDPFGDITLTAIGGNIVDLGGAGLAQGASVMLSAGGNIGTAGRLFAVQVVDSAQAPFVLDAAAGGDLDLSVKARLRDPAAFFFQPQLASLTAGGNINLDLLGAVRDSTVLGPDYTVGVTTSAPSFGGLSTTTNVDVAWPNDNGTPPPLPPGIFAFGSTPYGATYSIALLQAGGSISVTDPGPATIGLTANTKAGGIISAAVSGDIDLTELDGNLAVGSIVSSTGAVTLTTVDGSILDRATGTGAAVAGTSITLTANGGGIATKAHPLLVHSTARRGLHVTSTGPAYVEEAGLGWSVGDGGTSRGRVRWA